MPFTTFFLLAISVGFFVFLLYYTEVAAEYGWPLKKLLKLDEYKDWKENNQGAGYPVFLRESYNCFWTRMVGCPYCIITFSNLVLQTIFTNATLFLAGGFVSMLVFVVSVLAHRFLNKNEE